MERWKDIGVCSYKHVDDTKPFRYVIVKLSKAVRSKILKDKITKWLQVKIMNDEVHIFSRDFDGSMKNNFIFQATCRPEFMHTLVEWGQKTSTDASVSEESRRDSWSPPPEGRVYPPIENPR